MKALTKFSVILAITLTLNACQPANAKSKAPLNEEYLEDNKAWPGMFFSSANVVDEYEYDDAYVLLYDDADANMFNVEICVDLETYELVTSTIENGQEMDGELVLNDDYSVEGAEVFTFMPEHGRSVKMECLSIK